MEQLNRELNLIRNKKSFEPSKFIEQRTKEFLRYLEKFNLHLLTFKMPILNLQSIKYLEPLFICCPQIIISLFPFLS